MHDYDISWDYMLDDYVEKKNISLMNKIIKEIKKDILPTLNFCNDFKVYPIILTDKILGVYCKDTCENPVIGIDIRNILIGCEEYNVDIVTAIKTTILHELKHAWQEYNNKEFDEVEAEDFAFNYS